MNWSWKWGGLALGLVFLAAVVLVKPIGVSTQFVIFDGILWNSVNETVVQPDTNSASGYASSNAYLNKSGGKYAKAVSDPVNYSFLFVIAMIGGAAVSGLLRGGNSAPERQMPGIWRDNFGDSTLKRYLTTFIAGFVVLYGARLAGGCTSGHMMSGMMQTATSGYLFAAGAFGAGIPVAMLLFRKEA